MKIGNNWQLRALRDVGHDRRRLNDCSLAGCKAAVIESLREPVKKSVKQLHFPAESKLTREPKESRIEDGNSNTKI